MYINELMENIIAMTNYKENEYVLLNNNGIIKYVIVEGNGKINYNISDEALLFLQKLYDVITFDFNNAVYCSKYRINGKLFDIFKDKTSGIYTFLLNYKNKLFIPSVKDVILLNSYFNNEKIVYSENIIEEKEEIKCKRRKKKKYKFFRKILLVCGIPTLTFISLTTITYNLPQSTKNILYTNINSIVNNNRIKPNSSYTFEDIKVAIQNNNSIPKEDKEFIENVFAVEFEENKNYINTANIIEKLKTLDVEYHKYYTLNEKTGKYEITYDENFHNNVAAYYDINGNKMVCLENAYSENLISEKINQKFGFNEISKSVYYHELNHVFTTFELDNCSWKDTNNVAFEKINGYAGINLEEFSEEAQEIYNSVILTETINEIFTQEYVDKYYQNNKNEKIVKGYGAYLPYMYCLAEILPTETLREFKFNNDENLIINELINIGNNQVEAYKLITSLKCINLYENLLKKAENTGQAEKIKAVQLEQQENYKRIHDGINYMYKAKYNKNMFDDINMLTYLYNTPVITNTEKEKVKNYFGISNDKINVKYKGYFSHDYIKNHPNTVVSFVDKNGKNKIIELDNTYKNIEYR